MGPACSSARSAALGGFEARFARAAARCGDVRGGMGITGRTATPGVPGVRRAAAAGFATACWVGSALSEAVSEEELGAAPSAGALPSVGTG